MNGIGAAYAFLGAILVGVGLGYGADVLFHRPPWGILLGCALGFAVGLYGVYQALMKSSDHTE